MANTRSSDLLHQVRTLFGAGTVTGLTDAQLLERFRSRSARAAEDIAAAEAAFEVLVARHGPMVLGVCRRALADPAEVEDAFQATFLVLVRRAGSVRVGDSLGRWLYGVSRRVAAKAQARSRRARSRTIPLQAEPPAPDAPADQSGLLEALDDELSRLPAKYRAPVVLCHLEGLSHAEAAARLQWPVGTVSGRLSRARGLLKDRLMRRGLTSTAGSMAALLAEGGARAAVPEPLAAATVRAAARASMTGTPQVVAASATVLTLMSEVLRDALVVKLKAAAAVLVALAVACTAAVHFVGAARARSEPDDRTDRRQMAIGAPASLVPQAGHRPADEIVGEIEALLKTAHRPEPQPDFMKNRIQIAMLVDELRTAYPDDPRLTLYLPERWEALTFLNRRADIYAEVSRVLASATDPELRNEALLFEACLKNLEPIDGRTAVSLAESFSQQAPSDNRTGELLRLAASKLDDDWYLRVGLLVIFAVTGALTMFATLVRRDGAIGWLGLAGCLVGLPLVLSALLLFTFRFLSCDRQNAIYGSFSIWFNLLSDPNVRRKATFIVFAILTKYPEQLLRMAWSGRTAIAVTLAVAVAIAVVVHRRFGAAHRSWISAIRQAILGFLAVLGIACGIDAFLIDRKRNAIEDQIVREYPSILKNRLVEAQQRRARIGEPFGLNFADAITGRPMSIAALRGKIVVLHFWASYGDPSGAEIRMLKKAYAEFHDQGVEFIGVSLDPPAESGGLDSIKAFVAKQQIPWPQFHDDLGAYRGTRPGAPAGRLLESARYYQGLDRDRYLPQTAAGDFAESWGITSLPTVFLIDAEGKLYSTDAQGQLETLVPRLLAQSKNASGRD